MARAFALFFVLATTAAAQLNNSLPALGGHVRVHVDFTSGGTCDASINATITSTNGPVADGFVDRNCVIELTGIPSGHYYVTVSGKSLLTTETTDVDIDSSDTRDVEVKVKRAGDPDHTVLPSEALVSAADLKIPANAAHEFNQATRFIDKQDWPRAIEHLNKAVTIYPDYTGAYNNLGVIYARLSDRPHERVAFQNAIRSNDHFAPAYINLARVEIALANFPSAETLLTRAFALDPTDPKAVTLLAYAEYMNHHIDQAIVHSRRAHAMPQSQHATVHWVAAHAFEQKKQVTEALAELRLFLAEEQSGSRADAVRKELAHLQSAQ